MHNLLKISFFVFLIVFFTPFFAIGKCLKGNCDNGEGKATLLGVKTYEGTFVNGQPYGTGILALSNGYTVKGTFNKWSPVGKCYLVCKDSSEHQVNFGEMDLSDAIRKKCTYNPIQEARDSGKIPQITVAGQGKDLVSGTKRVSYFKGKSRRTKAIENIENKKYQTKQRMRIKKSYGVGSSTVDELDRKLDSLDDRQAVVNGESPSKVQARRDRINSAKATREAQEAQKRRDDQLRKELEATRRAADKAAKEAKKARQEIEWK